MKVAKGKVLYLRCTLVALKEVYLRRKKIEKYFL